MSGNIDISALKVPPSKSEHKTAKFFAEKGKRIVFIPPSAIPGVHTPDIIMDGKEWEIKCPEGSSKRTIENNIRKAEEQSENIIIDLRSIKVAESICISQIKRNFESRSKVKRILVITKKLELKEFSKSK